MVLAGSSSAKTEGKPSGNTSNLNEENETDPENELTPDTSSMSSSSSSSASSIFSTPIVTSQNTNNEPPAFQPHLNHRAQERSNLTTKQQYEQIHSEYLRQYEAMGILIQDNAWYSTYVQQLALYKYM